jgi:hypothetical protein
MTINGGQFIHDRNNRPDNYSTSVANLKLLVNGSYVTTIDSLNNSIQYTHITSIGEITLNLAQQVFGNNVTHRIILLQHMFHITTPPSVVNFSYLDIDDVWQPLNKLLMLNSTPVIFTVPSINANNGLTIAVKVGNCYSESQFITLGDVETNNNLSW